jgi:hypothetical protein
VIPESTRQRLKYIRVSDAAVSLECFPSFLIIGPQRTGTTWLHANLRYHPQIFLSEPKELLFFNRLKTPHDPRFQSNDLGWYLRFFRDPPWRVLLKTTFCLYKYREPYRPRVRGEATASYAALERDVIEEIALLNPDIRAVLMIRDPIDRAWSHAKKDLVRKTNRKVEEVPESEFAAFFADEYQRQCARYAENYDNWSACLEPGHMFVGAFDDIASRPEGLLLDVMSFLGVSSDRRYISGLAREAVNPTAASKVPERYRRFLEELLSDDIDKLRERFGLSWHG